MNSINVAINPYKSETVMNSNDHPIKASIGHNINKYLESSQYFLGGITACITGIPNFNLLSRVFL